MNPSLPASPPPRPFGGEVAAEPREGETIGDVANDDAVDDFGAGGA